jgi:hypothetical protein
MTNRIKRLTAKRDECAKSLENWFLLKGDPKVLAVHKSNLEFTLNCIEDYLIFRKRLLKFHIKLYGIIALIIVTAISGVLFF